MKLITQKPLIDILMALLAVGLTVDYFVRGSNHTPALGMYALYATGMILRIRYLINQYEKAREEGL